jgi:hypothetical protein
MLKKKAKAKAERVCLGFSVDCQFRIVVTTPQSWLYVFFFEVRESYTSHYEIL